MLQGLQLSARAFERCLAEQEVQRRIRGFHRGDDRRRGTNGIARLLAATAAQVLHVSTGGVRVVGNRTLSLARRASRPVGAKSTGLYERDLDAERRNFDRQRFREPFHGKLGGVVVGERRKTLQSADRGNVDDVSAAL